MTTPTNDTPAPSDTPAPAASDAAPSPAPSDAPTPVAEPQEPFPLDMSFESIVEAVEGAPQPQPAPAPAPQPAPPAPAAQQQPPAQAQPQAQPPQVQQPAPQGQQPPGQPQPDPLKALQDNREALIGALAQEQFKLSDADITELNENAGAFIAKKAAQVYFMSQVNLMEQLRAFGKELPRMILGVVNANQANVGLEQKLFEQFPPLKGVVTQKDAMFLRERILAKTPGIGQEDFIKALGQGLMRLYELQAAPAGQPAPKPQNGGFRPAPSGVPVVQQVVDEQPWAGMAADHDE